MYSKVVSGAAPAAEDSGTVGIIHHHGGMVHCYSEPGLGTSFKIYLPAAEVAAADVGNKLTGAVPRGNERLLVADDQPEVLSILTRLLGASGYAVTAVTNGAEAVAASRSELFDLHILDAIMPVMSGREACERIRAQRPSARFLFLSGYGGDALPQAFIKAQGIELIAKPFDPDALLRAVRANLDAEGR